MSRPCHDLLPLEVLKLLQAQLLWRQREVDQHPIGSAAANLANRTEEQTMVLQSGVSLAMDARHIHHLLQSAPETLRAARYPEEKIGSLDERPRLFDHRKLGPIGCLHRCWG